MAEYTYEVDKECPLCSKSFTVTKMKSRLIKVKQDTDFCTYYKDINPYYYSIWACPHCGYAAQDTQFDDISPVAREKLVRFLTGRQVSVNFCGVRTREQAVATYKLAVFYSQLLDAADSRLGGLYLKMAWLYREAGETGQEQLALENAVRHYEQALLRERLPAGNMTETTLGYLVGDLFRRTGNIDQAVAYLNKIVSNQQAKVAERNIYNLARQVWQEIRESKKNAAVGEATEQ